MARVDDLPPHLRPHDEQPRPHAELPLELTLPVPEIRDTHDRIEPAPAPPPEPFLRR